MIVDGDARDGRVVGVAEDGRLSVRDAEGDEIASFAALWSRGGRRAVLAADGRLVVTAAWVGGVAAITVEDGLEVWRRPDLGHAQVLVPVAGGRRPMLAVLREGRPSLVLNPLTGREIGRVSGRSGASADGWLLTSTGKRLSAYHLADWDAVRAGPRWQVASDRLPRVLVVGDGVGWVGGNGVTALALADGTELWRWRPVGCVVHALGRRADGSFVVVHHDPGTGLGACTLVAADGTERGELPAPPGEVLAFEAGAAAAVLADGTRWIVAGEAG